MDEDFEALLKALPAQHPRVYPTPEQIARFREKLPDRLLAYWAEFGWGGFGNGMFWLVNPDEYSSILGAWCGNSLEYTDVFIIGRTAFGELIGWKKGYGKFVEIISLENKIFTSPPINMS